MFLLKKKGTKWSFSVKVEPIVPRSEFRAEQFSSLRSIWELLYFVPKNVFLLITRELVFLLKKKKQNKTKWSFSVKVEPIVPRSELRAEQFSSLCAIGELLYFVPKNVFLLITRERVFYLKKKKQNKTKWSFSVKVEPIVPSSDSRAEQIGPLSVI